MVDTSLIPESAPIFAAFLWAGLSWLGLKRAAARRDWCRLWDWTDAIGAAVGTALMLPAILLATPPAMPMRTGVILYHIVTVWASLSLHLWIWSLYWEQESSWSVPQSLTPIERRFYA